MIKINLLPFREARTKENVRQQVSVFVLMLILTLIAMGYYNRILGKRIDNYKASISSIQQEVKKYEKAAKEVDEIKRKLEILKQKLGVIESLEKNRKMPVVILDQISDLVIPSRMWFNDFNSNANQIKFQGTALDNQTIADFMTNLENSPFFDNVNLTSSKQRTIQNDVNLKDFQIICNKTPLDKETKSPPKK